MTPTLRPALFTHQHVVHVTHRFSDPDRAYRVAFAMYTRHFCQLHTVSSAPEGLLRLCAVFERLLQSEGPELLDHLLMIGVEPLAVALPWMMTAFAGVRSSRS